MLHIHWSFIVLSSFVTFAVLLALVRWIGSTQLTQLTYFNWVAGAAMGNMAANMMTTTDKSTWVASCLSLVMFTLATIIASYIALKNRHFRRVTSGEPVVLIHKGALLRENLRKSKVNLDVLLMTLREKGYFSYGDIEYGILEPTGNLSILPTQASQSASKEDLVEGPDLSPKGQGPYIEIVIDGEVDRDKLKSTNHDQAWLESVLERHKINSLADVLYLAVNEQGDIILDGHRRMAPDDPLV
ncbi:DUF421 domain-containing protein [Alicyclobacillus sp. ALC3]|uniref:DUF421 domain-containing protein n=1 Tax=Alicyclobacillus sp. ALC3 TaxID=2796143 RepID=UPI0023786473|nr:YetF domain-containing protein [Alicyclobacillus sp. ALC3]WDL97981.1 DUF421 domain-containing protein [Alicyclobacillus sp. ALC3]